MELVDPLHANLARFVRSKPQGAHGTVRYGHALTDSKVLRLRFVPMHLSFAND